MYLFRMLKAAEYDMMEHMGHAHLLAYHPRMALRFGGPNAALLLLALIEFESIAIEKEILMGNITDKDSNEVKAQKIMRLIIVATDEMITDFTGLTKSQQRTAFKKLRERDLIWEEISGLPATRHTRVNFLRMAECLQ